MEVPRRVSQTKKLTTSSSVKAKEYFKRYREMMFIKVMTAITAKRIAQRTSSKRAGNQLDFFVIIECVRGGYQRIWPKG
jgi:hypothetical protein